MIRLFTLGLIFILGVALPSSAREAAFAINPNTAYVIIQVEDMESAVSYGNRTAGVITLARYDSIIGDVRGGDVASISGHLDGTTIRVTTLGRPLVRINHSRLYIIALEPDTWVVEGANGTAFSLGSMTFTVAGGQIVDLGVFRPVIDWAEGERPAGMGLGVLFGRVGPREIRPARIDWHARTSADIPLPELLNSHNVVEAVFDPNHRFGNYLGGLVNRFGGRASRLGNAQTVTESAAVTDAPTSIESQTAPTVADVNLIDDLSLESRPAAPESSPPPPPPNSPLPSSPPLL